MKIRNDFVTNSSSTCYTIAYKKYGKDNENGILNHLDELFEAITQTKCCGAFDNERDYLARLKKQYAPSHEYDESCINSLKSQIEYDYRMAKPYFESGFEIYYIDVNYYDDAMHKLIEMLETDKDHFAVLEGDYE